MKKPLSLLILLIAAVMGATAQTSPYSLQVGDFTEINVASSIPVVYKNVPDSAGTVVFRCTSSIAPVLTFSNKRNKLKIELTSDNPIVGQIPVVTVYSTTLAKVTNWGDSLVVVESPASCQEFKAKVVGNGTMDVRNVHATKIDANVEAGHGFITVSGQVNTANLNIAGSGSIDALALSAIQVKCVMGLGSGFIKCDPSQKLSIMGASSGTVYYRGDPEIKKRSMGVSLEHVDEE